MSSSSSTLIIGIGPSGSSQATVTLTTPNTAIATSLTTTTPFIMSTMSSPNAFTSPTSPTPTPTPTQSASSGSAASRNPNLGTIIGGTLGGIAALLWILGLLWWAHRNSWFRRPGYKRHRDTDRAFKRSPITPTTESAAPYAQPPQPQMGMIGARTFGQSQPQPQPSTRMSFGDPPRPSYGDPPRTNFERTSFGDLPRPNFGPAPPVPPRPNPAPPLRSSSGFGFNDRPLSTLGDRPMSTFGDRDRPRSGFGDRPRSGFGDSRRSLSPDRVRRFLRGNNKPDEWEGAGRRISMEPGSPEMEDRGGVVGFFARVKESAERRKRVKAEYEEDMRRMRGRSMAESDYGR
ncbi:hypothetical protein RSAG8_10970, partial [Rhizoctonia solani AG-8 WAC10335]